MRKYIGRTIEIIYLDRRNKITKRTIRVHSVKDGRIRAYCLTQKAPRSFMIDNILAVGPAERVG